MTRLDWDKERKKQVVARTRKQGTPVTLPGRGCWCGERLFHDWPGKEEGQPHPR